MMRVIFRLLGFVLCLGAQAADQDNALESLTLTQAHALALRNHPQINAANYRTLAAEQAVKQARSGFYPAATLYASAVGADSQQTRIMAGGLNNPSVFDRAAQGFGASMLITDFGRTANLTASSKFQADAEHQNAAATRELVLLQVDASYFGVLKAEALLHVAEQTLAARQALLDLVSLQVSNKLKSELDLSFAHVVFEQARLLVEETRNNADASRAALSAALGFHELHAYQLADESLPPTTTTNEVYRLIDLALQDRPELASLRNGHEADLRFARAQRDARWPVVAAVGTVGNSFIHDDRLPDNYAAAGIQLSMPLFAGGLYVARQHEAEDRAQAAAELLRSAEDNVVRDVRIAWLSLSNAEQRLNITTQLLKHATDAFTLAEARYQVGSSSIVELSQSQLDLTSAQMAHSGARYDVLIQQATLNYQIGALSASADTPARNSATQPKTR